MLFAVLQKRKYVKPSLDIQNRSLCWNAFAAMVLEKSVHW